MLEFLKFKFKCSGSLSTLNAFSIRAMIKLLALYINWKRNDFVIESIQI